MLLTDLGWGPFFEKAFEPIGSADSCATRVIRENRGQYLVVGETGEYRCELSGKYRYQNDDKANTPTVGDWVVADHLTNDKKAVIRELLPRKSVFSRKVAGQKTAEQVVAANIDTVFLVTGLDLNYNLRRIERYLTMAWNSGATPVILLNKADLCADDTDLKKIEVENIAIGVDVHTLSATGGNGMEIFNRYVQKGKTVAFIGSSGVGKSTIINRLIGEDKLKVNEVSELGSRGRHTTTSRELIVLPDGGMVIDTPGMRELQLWGNEESLDLVFDDIDQLSLNCRFKDCAHVKEPGCAVQKALGDGTLDQKRFESFLKLKSEFAYLSERQSMSASAVEKARWKEISKLTRHFKDTN